jgi:hypothetical protein
MLKLDQVKLTAAEADGGAKILASFPKMTKQLPKCSLEEVRKLLKVELDTRRRPTHYARLLSRFNSLEAEQNAQEMEVYIASKHHS